jgi:hypothetical protein
MYDVTGNEKNETVVPKKGRNRSPKRNEAQGQSDDVQNMCMQYRDKMCAQHTHEIPETQVGSHFVCTEEMGPRQPNPIPIIGKIFLRPPSVTENLVARHLANQKGFRLFAHARESSSSRVGPLLSLPTKRTFLPYNLDVSCLFFQPLQILGPGKKELESKKSY